VTVARIKTSSGWVDLGGGGGGGIGEFYEQAEEPTSPGLGAIWFDPDADGGGGGLNYVGAFSLEQDYSENDVVTYKGASWIAPGDISSGSATPGESPSGPTLPSVNLPTWGVITGIRHLPANKQLTWVGPTSGSGYDIHEFFYIDIATAGTVSFILGGFFPWVTIKTATDSIYYDARPSSNANLADRSLPAGRLYLSLQQFNEQGTVEMTLGTATLTPPPAAGAQWERLSPSYVDQVWTPQAGYTKDRVFDPETAVVQEVARALGTLIDDLKTSGVIKLS
jgi:hypothetical protein